MFDAKLGEPVSEIVGPPIDFGDGGAIAFQCPAHVVFTEMRRHPTKTLRVDVINSNMEQGMNSRECILRIKCHLAAFVDRLHQR
jgi:hypothetical protein